MYIRGEVKKEILKPFEVKCTNCGSHNVDVVASEWQDLLIRCQDCYSYLECGTYNETQYKMVGEGE